jgi:hypothetical protein
MYEQPDAYWGIQMLSLKQELPSAPPTTHRQEYMSAITTPKSFQMDNLSSNLLTSR